MQQQASVVAVVFTFLAAAAAAAGAQPPRTAWGVPDLRGVWNNGTITQLERPDALGDKTHFTAAEAEALRGTGLERILDQTRGSAEFEASGELNEIFLEPGTEVVRSRRTSLVVDPPNGKIPYQPDARERRIYSMRQLIALTGPIHSYEDIHIAGRCLWAGTFYYPINLYLNTHQIFQTPDHVVIVSENGPQVRVVPLDGRPPLDASIRQRNGSSRGYWEGDTLVIETANFADSHNPLAEATAGMRLLERLTRFDDNTIDYALTVTDPAAYTQPWTLEHTLRAVDGPLYEFACHEGNYGLTNILAGARAEEAEAEAEAPDTAARDAEAAAVEAVEAAYDLRRMRVGDLDMRVAVDGSGPLVLLLHGFPESWYSWRRQLPALAAAGYTVVAPDMRGYGGTVAPEPIEAYDMAHLCRDVAGLVDAFGGEPAVLVGHDWGAAIAWDCMRRDPQKYRAVAGLSVPAGPRRAQRPTDALRALHGENFFYMLYFQQPGVAEAEMDADPRAVTWLFASPDTPRTPPRITDPRASAGGFLGRRGAPTEQPSWLTARDADYLVAQFAQRGFRGPVNYYRNIDRNWEASAALDPVVKQPALFIAGARDFVVAGQSPEQLRERMAPVLADLRGVHLIDGAGHWIQQEAAEEVNRLLIDFLDGAAR